MVQRAIFSELVTACGCGLYEATNDEIYLQIVWEAEVNFCNAFLYRGFTASESTLCWDNFSPNTREGYDHLLGKRTLFFDALASLESMMSRFVFLFLRSPCGQKRRAEFWPSHKGIQKDRLFTYMLGIILLGSWPFCCTNHLTQKHLLDKDQVTKPGRSRDFYFLQATRTRCFLSLSNQCDWKPHLQ